MLSFPIRNAGKCTHSFQSSCSLLLLVSSTWTSTPVRVLGSPRLQGEPCSGKHKLSFTKLQHRGLMINCGCFSFVAEKAFSAPSKSVTYSGLQQHERWARGDTFEVGEVCFAWSNPPVPPSCRESDASSDRSFGQVGERRRELVRSQTLPRNIGAQTRRSIFERLDSEASNR